MAIFKISWKMEMKVLTGRSTQHHTNQTHGSDKNREILFLIKQAGNVTLFVHTCKQKSIISLKSTYTLSINSNNKILNRLSTNVHSKVLRHYFKSHYTFPQSMCSLWHEHNLYTGLKFTHLKVLFKNKAHCFTVLLVNCVEGRINWQFGNCMHVYFCMS